MTQSDYTQQLEDTIRRQELELIKCREWQDSLYESLGRVRNNCTNQVFTQEALDDLQGMHNVDMAEIMCDFIRENGKKIIDEEIQKIASMHGK